MPVAVAISKIVQKLISHLIVFQTG